MKRAWLLIRDVVSEFMSDGALPQAAAIAFYTMFSLAPLLVIAIAVAGMAFGREAAQDAIVREFRSVMGEDAAELIQSLVQRAANSQKSGVVATIVGVATLLLGSLGVFGQLKSALNSMWDVKLRTGLGFWGLVRDYVLSFAMVACIAFLLLVSLALSAALAAARTRFGESVPMGESGAAVLDVLVSLLVTAALFGAMYKILPDVRAPWRTVVVGAAFTALLFSAGKFLIGAYLGSAAIVSVYGTAGSLVMILVWVYYSSIILLFGAEVTQVTARRLGMRIEPRKNAEWVRPASEDAAAPAPGARARCA